jgi:hypothetical protein
VTRPLLAAAALAGVVSVPLGAQPYKTTVETRRVSGPLVVEVAFAVGDLYVHPADNGRSYRVAMTYREDLFEPTVRFDPDGGRLAVKLEGNRSELDLDDVDADDQELDLALPRGIPLDLDLSFGAIEAEIELGGLTLRSARVQTGASETTVSFATPTQGACDRLAFAVGAAEFEALQIGNSGCREVSLEGAVGEMHLDFTGRRWSGETRLHVKVGLGEVRISVPEEVGVRMNTSRFLASVSQVGLVRRGSSYESPGFDRAPARLVIEVDAALGSIALERVAGAR